MLFQINPDKQYQFFSPRECPYCGGKLEHTPDNEDWIPLISGMYVKGKVCETCKTVCHVGMDMPISNRKKRDVVKHFIYINHEPFSVLRECEEQLKQIDDFEELSIFICDKFGWAKLQVRKKIIELCDLNKVSDTWRPRKC